MHTAILLLVAATFLLHAPTTANAKDKDEGITTVVITNNHTNYLSIRCFSFDNDFDAIHVPAGGQYRFPVKKRVVYPSSTMFNCSTNMGTFIAYKFNYDCAKNNYKTCDWRFDEDSAYSWSLDLNDWVPCDYSPNYESLARGGVIKGYFAN